MLIRSALTRADFLKSFSLAVLGVAANPGSLLPWRSRIETASVETFRPYVNEPFVIRKAGGSATKVALKSVTEGPRSQQFEQFSVIFHGAPGARLSDGMYRVQHPALGEFNLFIAVIGMPNNRRTAYQACFSRVR